MSKPKKINKPIDKLDTSEEKIMKQVLYQMRDKRFVACWASRVQLVLVKSKGGKNGEKR